MEPSFKCHFLGEVLPQCFLLVYKVQSLWPVQFPVGEVHCGNVPRKWNLYLEMGRIPVSELPVSSLTKFPQLTPHVEILSSTGNNSVNQPNPYGFLWNKLRKFQVSSRDQRHQSLQDINQICLQINYIEPVFKDFFSFFFFSPLIEQKLQIC